MRALMPRLSLCLCLCLALTGCGRPLTGPEVAFLVDLTGPGLDPAPVRIMQNPLLGLVTQSFPARPRTTCRERVVPPPPGPMIEGRVGGMVLFNRLMVRPDILLDDYSEMPDGRRNLHAAMFLAHEMIHVWQWQNRALTGYHPLRAAREHAVVTDPYLFDEAPGRRFLDYGYEAQASLVEEYVCCRALDPRGARTARLEALIGQAMAVTPWTVRADGAKILVPWPGVQARGICS